MESTSLIIMLLSSVAFVVLAVVAGSFGNECPQIVAQKPFDISQVSACFIRITPHGFGFFSCKCSTLVSGMKSTERT